MATRGSATDFERIAWSYANLCLAAYADDGWDTLKTLRWYNSQLEGIGFQKPGGSPGVGQYIQVSRVFLDEDDLAVVAAQIDALLAADAHAG